MTHRIRRPWQTVAIIAGVGIVFFLIALRSVTPFSSERARTSLVAFLSDRLDSDVQLDSLRLRLLPTVRAEGTGFSMRQRGRQDVPPVISIQRFTVEGSVLNLLRKHVSTVWVEGLDIQIPPRRRDTAEAQPGSTPPGPTPPAPADAADRRGPSSSNAVRAIVIDELLSTSGRLVIIPRNKDKDPKEWAIHNLRMTSVSVDRSMPFEATLTNAVPPGDIVTMGTFGPWNGEDPGDTPLAGTFVFDNADLGVFKGIKGILSSRGNFGGSLDHIDVQGDSNTPDFTVTAGGHPVSLQAKYHAIVDGTNGDTILERVDASFLKTSIVASGGVIKTPGRKGRTVTLDVTMDQARIEDVLTLVIKAPRPPMTGALQLKTTLELPPGDVDVIEKLRLNGRFAIAGTRFTNLDVQGKINELSRRGRGKVDEPKAQQVSSDFQGTFKLGGGTLTIPSVAFGVPGSMVRLAGTYALVPETLNFSGTLYMDVKISETTTGFRSLLLKMVDPFFRRPGGGSAIPIKITGKRSDPSFGLDRGRVFGRN